MSDDDKYAKADTEPFWETSLQLEYKIAEVTYALLLKEKETQRHENPYVARGDNPYVDCIVYLSEFAQVVEKHLKKISVNVEDKVTSTRRRGLMLCIYTLLNRPALFSNDLKTGDESNPIDILATVCGRIKGLLGKGLHYNAELSKFELKE